jgi:hypothetical protein
MRKAIIRNAKREKTAHAIPAKLIFFLSVSSNLSQDGKIILIV